METTTKQMKEAVKGKTTDSDAVKSAVKPLVKPGVKSFRDLGTWQLAQELAVAVYRQCELFPETVSVLTCQMTQAALTACANIAESFSQRGEQKERTFISAQDALKRLESHILIAEGLGYINEAQLSDLTRRSSNTYWALAKLQKINREWMQR